HADQAVIGGDHEQAVIGGGGKEAEDSGAEVALVAGKVSEGDYLRGSCANFGPGELAAGYVAGHDVAMGVEAHDFHTYRRGSAGFDLMFVAEEVDSSLASTVIEI